MWRERISGDCSQQDDEIRDDLSRGEETLLSRLPVIILVEASQYPHLDNCDDDFEDVDDHHDFDDEDDEVGVDVPHHPEGHMHDFP